MQDNNLNQNNNGNNNQVNNSSVGYPNQGFGPTPTYGMNPNVTSNSQFGIPSNVSPTPNFNPSQPYNGINNGTMPNYEFNPQYGQYPPFDQNNGMGNPNNGQKKNNTKPLIVFGAVFLVAIVLVITLILENKNDINGENNKKKLVTEDSKTLVVYFSKSGNNYNSSINNKSDTVNLKVGNTKIMAQKISSFIYADMYEIEPVTPYTDNLEELEKISKIEHNTNKSPDIKTSVSNLIDYDVIFIGFPIWDGSYPQIIKTFVDKNKSILKDKIIVPFNTHAGSGAAGTHDKLFNIIGTPKEKQLEGLALNGAKVKDSETEIKEWLNRIGYNVK